MKAGPRLDRKVFRTAGKSTDINRPNLPQPKLDSEIRKTYEEPGIPLPRITMVCPGVAQYSPDEAALDTLSSILSTGRGSRLQTELVYGKELAQQAGAFDQTSEIGGLIQVNVTARPGKSLEEIEKTCQCPDRASEE
jgi:zinc protease